MTPTWTSVILEYDNEVSLVTRPLNLRRVLLFAAPSALISKVFATPQETGAPNDLAPPGQPDDFRLPNGKSQRDAILKADYEQNLKDAQALAKRAKDFERELEKSDQYVFSLGLLKELDEIEKLARRIRGRMRRV